MMPMISRLISISDHTPGSKQPLACADGDEKAHVTRSDASLKYKNLISHATTRIEKVFSYSLSIIIKYRCTVTRTPRNSYKIVMSS